MLSGLLGELMAAILMASTSSERSRPADGREFQCRTGGEAKKVELLVGDGITSSRSRRPTTACHALGSLGGDDLRPGSGVGRLDRRGLG